MATTREDQINFSHLPGAPIKIEDAGISYCGNDYFIERETYPEAIFECIVSGKGVLCVNGENFFPKAGDVYIVPQYAPHHYKADPVDPWVKLWFNISGTLLPVLLSSYGLSETVLYPDVRLDNRFSEGLQILRQSRDSGSGENHSVLSLEIISGIIAELGNIMKERLGKCGSASINAFNSLGAMEPIPTLSEISKTTLLSQNQNIRNFKKKLGATPHAFFLNKKINLTMQMLRNTKMSVKEISLSAGFCDAGYFSRLFKRKTGLTPLQYRAKNPWQNAKMKKGASVVKVGEN
ncbi:MAG: AraC family transcriptional regulator [Victivallaceae bacterium]|nr:AraC family transcriptional regulator [Victivallaceae bacterium]